MFLINMRIERMTKRKKKDTRNENRYSYKYEAQTLALKHTNCLIL